MLFQPIVGPTMSYTLPTFGLKAFYIILSCDFFQKHFSFENKKIKLSFTESTDKVLETKICAFFYQILILHEICVE